MWMIFMWRIGENFIDIGKACQGAKHKDLIILVFENVITLKGLKLVYLFIQEKGRNSTCRSWCWCAKIILIN